MARKKEGGVIRGRAKQRAMYDELDKHPVLPPTPSQRARQADVEHHSPDHRALMTKKEQEQLDEIMDIFIRSLQSNIEEIDTPARSLPPAAMDKGDQVLRHENQQEIQVQDFLLHPPRPDWIRQDGRADERRQRGDISLDGTNVPSSPTTENSNPWKPPAWEQDEELESYVIKLAQRCGKAHFRG